MEYSPEHGFRPPISFLEQEFGIKQREFQRQTDILESHLKRYRYITELQSFMPVDNAENKRGIEVAFDKRTNSLFVFASPAKVIYAEDFAEMTLPAIAFMQKFEPDIVVGCDRGGRLYSLAIYDMWHKGEFGDFPTIDRGQSYARLSTSLEPEIVEDKLYEILKRNLEKAKNDGRHIGSKIKVLFIDDLIASGATRELILDSLGRISDKDIFETGFVVMCGRAGDATGSEEQVSLFWNDDVDMIGVKYDQEGNPYPNVTAKSQDLRRLIYNGVSFVSETFIQEKK